MDEKTVEEKAITELMRELIATRQARDRLLVENARLKRQVAALKKKIND